MAPLINTRSLQKSFGSSTLFREIAFSVSEDERVGLIGPNGSGKSTLLKILAGRMDPDRGEIALRKRVKLTYVEQNSIFPEELTVQQIMEAALEKNGIPETEWDARSAETLGRAGFDDFSVAASALSGGWKKRLAIAEALVSEPDILLLDEPTNHLDLEGIAWLEDLLLRAPFSAIVVSHDRYFLENIATTMVELNRAYPDGLFRVAGNYSTFLERKAEYLHAQSKQQESLENKVRTEMDWLRRGPKARTTKSKSRINRAHELIGELADLSSRMRTSSAGIDFSATERKTRRLIELEKVSYSIEGRQLLSELDFVVTAGTRIGLVGPNGSGKTTLLRLFRGELQPDSGEIRRADNLKIVYFDQNRKLDPDLTLKQALSPDGDSVIYQDRVIHVAAWAARFLFPADQLVQPVGRLSGGERARVLIARLMLEPADVLLLDEPTNDLDIPTLELLEESLLEFPGALVLVTHDRYLLDRVSTVVLGLDGKANTERFADYSQWEAWSTEQKQPKARTTQTIQPSSAAAAPVKKKLSYKDARDYETIEQRIAEAEQTLEEKQAALSDPSIMSDGPALQQAGIDLERAQEAVDALYARWAELEEKQQAN